MTFFLNEERPSVRQGKNGTDGEEGGSQKNVLNLLSVKDDDDVSQTWNENN